MIIFNATKLAAVAQAQSKEESRYYLCGVYFEGNIAVATDGHIATAAIDDDSTNDANGIYPVSKKAVTAMKRKDAENVTFGDNILTVLSDNNEVLYIEPSREIDGTFPNWRNIIPKERGPAMIAGFSDIIQRKLCDTAKILSAACYVLLGDNTEHAKDCCHTVDYGNPDVFSVAMPMRAKFSATQPEWIKAA